MSCPRCRGIGFRIMNHMGSPLCCTKCNFIFDDPDFPQGSGIRCPSCTGWLGSVMSGRATCMKCKSTVHICPNGGQNFVIDGVKICPRCHPQQNERQKCMNCPRCGTRGTTMYRMVDSDMKCPKCNHVWNPAGKGVMMACPRCRKTRGSTGSFTECDCELSHYTCDSCNYDWDPYTGGVIKH